VCKRNTARFLGSIEPRTRMQSLSAGAGSAVDLGNAAWGGRAGRFTCQLLISAADRFERREPKAAVS